MDSARYGNLLSVFDAAVSDYVGDSMSVYKHCIHYDGDEDCDKCCIHGIIFNCPSNCKDYLDCYGFIADNVYDECEIHENCTVEIWRNSQTGKISIGWYENKDERKND